MNLKLLSRVVVRVGGQGWTGIREREMEGGKKGQMEEGGQGCRFLNETKLMKQWEKKYHDY